MTPLPHSVRPTISVLMDLPPAARFHVATLAAISHACDAIGVDAVVRVVTTDAIGEIGDGVVIGPGSPYRDPRAAEEVIRAARERGVPLVGT